MKQKKPDLKDPAFLWVLGVGKAAGRDARPARVQGSKFEVQSSRFKVKSLRPIPRNSKIEIRNPETII